MAAIDWTNAVLIPVFLAVALGIPLAIYTGVVAARISTFQAARTEAYREFIALSEALLRVHSEPELWAMWAGLFGNSKVMLIGENQLAAVAVLEKLRGRTVEVAKAIIDQQLTPAEHVHGWFGVSPLRWAQIIARSNVGVLLGKDPRIIQPLTTLKPNYGAIFALPTFALWLGRTDRWLRRSACADCSKNCHRGVV